MSPWPASRGLAKVVAVCAGTSASLGAGLWGLRIACLCNSRATHGWEGREQTGNITAFISHPPFLENPPEF